MAQRRLVEKGDRLTIVRHPGYKLVQNRPYECKVAHVCKCGTCNGTRTEYPGTVTDVIFWGDGAVECVVLCDDGEVRRKEVRPCNLDPC